MMWMYSNSRSRVRISVIGLDCAFLAIAQMPTSTCLPGLDEALQSESMPSFAFPLHRSRSPCFYVVWRKENEEIIVYIVISARLFWWKNAIKFVEKKWMKKQVTAKKRSRDSIPRNCRNIHSYNRHNSKYHRHQIHHHCCSYNTNHHWNGAFVNVEVFSSATNHVAMTTP